jgi:hypothetical protein
VVTTWLQCGYNVCPSWAHAGSSLVSFQAYGLDSPFILLIIELNLDIRVKYI